MKKKILVVDDNRMVLKFLSNLLTREGHEVKTCEDGLSALSLLATYQPDVAFVDLILPKIGGEKLCQTIRTMAHMQDCFLVILSAAVADLDMGYSAIGVNSCIAKGPFGEMGNHVLAAIEESVGPDRSNAGGEIREIASIGGVPGYARRMTKELLARAHHLETILESLNEAIVEVYAGQVVYANAAAVKLFAISLEALLSAKPWDLFDETARDRVDVLMDRNRNAASVVGLTCPLEHNGRQIVVRGFPLEGETDTTILLINDVTEQRNLEYQLQHARRMDAIGKIAGGIAHNFNNLLMGIQANVSILNQNLKVGDPGFDELTGIERCVDSGAKLTRQLLRYAKDGRCVMDLVDLNDIVEKTINLFVQTRNEIQVIKHLDRNPAMVAADSAQIELVLMDLFVNAWHAMAHGGTLTVSTNHVALDGIFLKPYNLDPGEYLEISVADTGSGMDEATIERIFEPFYTTRHMTEGTGLGLASVFGIVNKHRGLITVKSDVGQGTTFVIYLPEAKNLNVSDVSTPVQETALTLDPAKGTGTILVVDDEEIILDAVEILLTELGYTVLLASGGEEALRIVEEKKGCIDLLILDLVMPNVSGEVVYERIKSLHPNIRVLLSSGYSFEEQAETMLKGNCDDFIQKPYNLVTLAEKIKIVLQTDMMK